MVKNDVKKTEYNPKIKNIEDKIPDITKLATKTILNAETNEVKGEIPSITNTWYYYYYIFPYDRRRVNIVSCHRHFHFVIL